MSQRYGFAIMTWAVVAAMLVVAFQLVHNPAWRPPGSTAGSAPGLSRLGRPSQRPPSGAASPGNLIANWSFERDLSGWQVKGPGRLERVVGGHRSGASGGLRLAGAGPASISIDYPAAAEAVQVGDRFVASAWVRSKADLQVAVSVISSIAGRQQSSQVLSRTRSGPRWQRIAVSHVVGLPDSNVSLRVTAPQLGPDRTLMVDEVTLRRG